MADESLYAAAERFERADEIDAVVAPWLAAHTADEAVEAFQANRVPASSVLDFAEVLRVGAARRPRGFSPPAPDLGPTARSCRSAPFVLGEPGPAGPPPAAGADTAACRRRGAARRSQRGRCRRVDLAGTAAARVHHRVGRTAGRPRSSATSASTSSRSSTRSAAAGTGGGIVERPPWRWGELAPPAIRAEIFPQAEPGERRWNRMGTWNKMNRSKRSLCLDAKPPDGAAVLEALIADADLVVHNFTPRGARSLGVDPERWPQLNPRSRRSR